MKNIIVSAILAMILFGSCEKEQCYPIIQKDHVVYIYKNDTLKSFYENVNTSFQYYGDGVEEWAKSQSYQITTLYECGGTVDGVHYKPLTIVTTHMTLYLITN
jgi:hypothetical protein